MSNRKEDTMQESCVKWYKMQYRNYLIMAFPAGFVFAGNQTKRAIMGKRMKDMGYTNGTPDLFIPIPNTRHSGLFIELKIKPNKPTVNQKEMMLKLHSNGYKCAVCYSIDEFIGVVNEYMNEL